MNFQNVLDAVVSYINNHNGYAVLIEVVITLIATWLLSKVVQAFVARLYKKFKKKEATWEEAIVQSMEKPLFFLVWMLGITQAIILLNIILKLEIMKAMTTVRSVGVIICIIWFVMNLISEFEEYWTEQVGNRVTKLDKTTVSALSKILRITAFVIAGLIALETLGFSISGMLAFGGVGGIAVSFASKDMLANFFGALMIYLDKPFRVGDWIRIPEKDIEGHVEKIGLRCTVVKTLEKRPLYVPNSIFSIASIENPSRMSHRKIKEEISLRHEDLHLISKITNEIAIMLKEHSSIDKKQSIVVTLDNLDAASANIMIDACTKAVETEEYYKVKHDVMLRIADIIDKYEAKLSQAVHMLQFPEEVGRKVLKNKKGRSAKKYTSGDE